MTCFTCGMVVAYLIPGPEPMREPPKEKRKNTQFRKTDIRYALAAKRKEQILRLLREGFLQRDIAEIVGVSQTYVRFVKEANQRIPRPS